MSHDTVARAVEWVFREHLAQPEITLVWHSGEPLALPVAWYEIAFARAAAAAPLGAVLTHAVQTNATLIDDDWCEFFRVNSVMVGVSLDGPAFLHDARRRTRNGRGTHAQAIRGTERLRHHGVPFHVIAVVTDSTLDHPDAFVDFFLEQGIHDIGLNIEEIEGVNRQSSLSGADQTTRFRRFFERLCERAAQTRALSIREIASFAGTFARFMAGKAPQNDLVAPFRIVTVSREGELFTFSPELAGVIDPRLGNLSLGNLSSATLETIVNTGHFKLLSEEISSGVAACEKTCPYFRLCGGGAPANKLAENGRFDTTETLYCRLLHQEISEILMARAESAMSALRQDSESLQGRRSC